MQVMGDVVEKAIIAFLAIMSLITIFAYWMAVREHKIEKKRSQRHD